MLAGGVLIRVYILSVLAFRWIVCTPYTSCWLVGRLLSDFKTHYMSILLSFSFWFESSSSIWCPRIKFWFAFCQIWFWLIIWYEHEHRSCKFRHQYGICVCVCRYLSWFVCVNLKSDVSAGFLHIIWCGSWFGHSRQNSVKCQHNLTDVQIYLCLMTKLEVIISWATNCKFFKFNNPAAS